MTLADFEFMPGVIVDANDPKLLGRVKIVAPGFQDNSTMDVKDMYWTTPFTSMGYQRLSKPSEGQKVWLLNNKKNKYESYYLPMWEANQNTAVAINGGADYDVLVSRSGNGTGAQMHYNTTEGFTTEISGKAKSNINPSGDITNLSNGTKMSIEGASVLLGVTDDCTHPGVLGDELHTLLSNLAAKLNDTAIAASSNCYTSNLANPLNECVKAINDTLEKIQSQHIFISK